MNLIKRLEKSLDFWFLLTTSFFFFLLRLPSIFEPYWYGDEGIYQVIGLALRQGRVLYSGIFDNKPPLLYVLYGIFNSEQDVIRVVSIVAGIGATIAIFLLAKKLFREKTHHKAVLVTTGVFAFLLASPLLEGNVANAENFMLLPIIVGGLFAFFAIETKRTDYAKKLFFISGLLFSIAFLFKIVAIFDFAAFITFFLILRVSDLNKIAHKKFIIENLKFFSPLLAGFLIPILAISLYFLLSGAFDLFVRATFLSNIGYVGYGNKFFVPQGLLFLKLAVLAAVLLVIFKRKNAIPHHLTFILVWLSFSLFNAMFSQRPYTHYLLVLLPSFSLLIGVFFYETTQRPRALLFILLFVFILSLNFSFGVKSIDYYKNFISFVRDQKSLNDYRRFFDKNTPMDYQLAEFLKANSSKEDNVFIWGNNAQVYKLINKIPPGRYIVAYHIISYKDGVENTKQALSESEPKYVVVMPNVNPLPFALNGYLERLRIENIIIYEKAI